MNRNFSWPHLDKSYVIRILMFPAHSHKKIFSQDVSLELCLASSVENARSEYRMLFPLLVGSHGGVCMCVCVYVGVCMCLCVCTCVCACAFSCANDGKKTEKQNKKRKERKKK